MHQWYLAMGRTSTRQRWWRAVLQSGTRKPPCEDRSTVLTEQVVHSTLPLCSSIPSHSQEPVKFKVKDRDHTLGSVALALAELPGSRNRLWLPLQPYKRAHEAHGSLQVGCWAVSYHQRERAATGSVQTSPQEDARPRGSRGPFGFHRHSSSWTRSTPHRHSMYEKPLGMVVAGGRVQDGLRSFQSDTNLRGAGEEEEEEGAQVKSSTDHSQTDITSSTVSNTQCVCFTRRLGVPCTLLTPSRACLSIRLCRLHCLAACAVTQ